MKIAIIGAMEEEVTLLRDKIEDKTVEVIAGCEFTAGKMDGVEVVLLRSGIGKVNAAMSTTILLKNILQIMSLIRDLQVAMIQI